MSTLMKVLTALLAYPMTLAKAHMILRSPVPAGNPNNSPLPNLDTYPCKGISTVAGAYENVMIVGEPNTLSFTGSAVHGGGSCQISLASGLNVDKSTKFKVIHSIEGGCPANVTGNLDGGPDGTGALQFQFVVPHRDDLAPGDYVLAWTWNNRVGNREFFMNCARVTLKGAMQGGYANTSMSISKRQEAPLPDVFVANLGNGCTIPEGIDVQYPNPGVSLEVAPNAHLGAPEGDCGSVGVVEPSAVSFSVHSSTSSSTLRVSVESTSNPYRGSTDDSTYSTQAIAGMFAMVSKYSPSRSTATPSTITPTAIAVEYAPNSTARANFAAASIGNTGFPHSADKSCEVGVWQCAADGCSFRRCIDGGTWSLPVSVARGMNCVSGTSTEISYYAFGNGSKRDLRSHIARRRLGLHRAVKP